VPPDGRLRPYRALGAGWERELSFLARYYGLRHAKTLEAGVVVTRTAKRKGDVRWEWLVTAVEPVPREWERFLPVGLTPSLLAGDGGEEKGGVVLLDEGHAAAVASGAAIVAGGLLALRAPAR